MTATTTTIKNITAKVIEINEQPAIKFSWGNQIAALNLEQDAWHMLEGTISAQKVMWNTLKDTFAEFIKEVEASLTASEEVEMTEEDIKHVAIERRNALETEYYAELNKPVADMLRVKVIFEEKKTIDRLLGVFTRTQYEDKNDGRARFSAERQLMNDARPKIIEQLKNLLVAA